MSTHGRARGKSWVSNIKSCHEIEAQKLIKLIELVGPRVLRIVRGCIALQGMTKIRGAVAYCNPPCQSLKGVL